MLKRFAVLFAIGVFVSLCILWLGRIGSDQNNTVRNSGVVSKAVEEGLQPDPIKEAAQLHAAGRVEVTPLLIQQARARGAAMSELIRTNPERAIQEALTLSEWSRLPTEIQAYVERPFSAVADVDVLIACGEKISQTMITTTFSSSDKMETYVYGRRNEVSTKTGIPVQGIRVGDIGALRAEVFQPLETADEAAALARFPVAVPDPGGDSVAALAGGKIFYFEDPAALDEANTRLAALEELPGPHVGPQALFEKLEAYITDGRLDLNAVEKQAYGASMAWTGTPRDMYVILVDFSDVTGQPADPVTLSNLLNTTVSDQIWQMSYEKTHIVGTVNTNTYRMPSVSSVYTNDYNQLHSDARTAAENDGVDLSSYETVCVLFPHLNFSWAGLASVGGVNMWLNHNTSDDVIVHELGHNYGLSHSSTWSVAGYDPVDPAGTKTEYGDDTDIMGDGRVPEGHFNAFQKQNINWFDAENWQSISSSGTYRVYRSDDRQTTALLRGLRIDKGASDYYWIGLRQQYPQFDSFSRGVQLIWKKFGDNRSYLLDMTPQSAAGKDDGGLSLGQTYSDTTAGVHITPVDRGGQTPNEWMDITVHLGAFPGNSAPSASLSGPTNLAVQASALFTVTASDPDGDELAYSWDIGDGLVKPNTPSIPVAWLTGGTATVSCVVSDMKGGTTNVSQAVVLSSPLDNWTQHTSGTTRDLMDIASSGTRVVVVADDETTLYSDDGTNWTSHQSFDVYAGNIFLEGITYDGSQFLACGMDYDFDEAGWEQTVYTSSDGTSWTERYDSNTGSSNNIRLNDLVYGGGVYVAVGDGGAIVRSTDSTSWSTNASGTTEDLTGVSYGDGTFVAVGAGSGGGPAIVLTSSDGLSWSNRSSGVDLDSWKGFYDVEYCKDRFLAGGWYARILHSTDQGQTFTTSMSGDRQVISAFAYGNGTYFAAGINKDDGNADINFTSVDGVNWTELSTSAQDDRNAAVYYNGTFITVGDNGSIWQSDPITASGGGFANWQLENQSALGLNRDPLDDADFDGSRNLAEYAMGTSATDAGEQPVDGVGAATGTYFQVSFARGAKKEDVNYEVERSVHLASNDWSKANTVVVDDADTNLTVRSAFPMSTQTNEFLRLKLELQ